MQSIKISLGESNGEDRLDSCLKRGYILMEKSLGEDQDLKGLPVWIRIMTFIHGNGKEEPSMFLPAGYLQMMQDYL